jgi:leucyl-tRNA synthetase
VWREALETMLKLLNPMVPHLAEDLWQALGYETSLQLAPWPAAVPEALVQATHTLVIQVNGKVRGELAVPAAASEEEIRQLACQHVQSDERLRKWVPGEPKKIILARRRLINIVV